MQTFMVDCATLYREISCTKLSPHVYGLMNVSLKLFVTCIHMVSKGNKKHCGKMITKIPVNIGQKTVKHITLNLYEYLSGHIICSTQMQKEMIIRKLSKTHLNV